MQGLMSILPELFSQLLFVYMQALCQSLQHIRQICRRIPSTMFARTLTTERRHIWTVGFQHQMFWSVILHHLMKFFCIWISDLPRDTEFESQLDKSLGFLNSTTKGMCNAALFKSVLFSKLQNLRM